jgi:hypothetical protein
MPVDHADRRRDHLRARSVLTLTAEQCGRRSRVLAAWDDRLPVAAILVGVGRGRHRGEGEEQDQRGAGDESPGPPDSADDCELGGCPEGPPNDSVSSPRSLTSGAQ